ncbi:unnamed protein product [Caenorhabditis nigoni]
MEALTNSGSDPLLSATLSSTIHDEMHDEMLTMDDDDVDDHCDELDHTSPDSDIDAHFIDFADDMVVAHQIELSHDGRTTSMNIYDGFETLTNLQPLPPISTVNSKHQVVRRSPTPKSGPLTYYFPTSSSAGFETNYEEDIKYEPEVKYEADLKYEADIKYEEEDDYSGLTHSTSSPSDYSNHGTEIIQQFSASSFESFDLTRSPMMNSTDKFIAKLQESDCSTKSPKGSSPAALIHGHVEDDLDDGEELNTKELSIQIAAELKRYSIPQAIFAERVLCRSQGTLSDLLRNPKPWSKLKSGRETFRRMAKWLEEPEFQRMSALRLAACKRKEEQSTITATQIVAPKKTRLVFTDIQRRTLQAIFKETKRPSREMQITISQQLQLDPTTVANFFMNARRRGHEKQDQEEAEEANRHLRQEHSSTSPTTTSSSSSSLLMDNYASTQYDINHINLLDELTPPREIKYSVQHHDHELDFPADILEP